MIEPRREIVLIRAKDSLVFADKTPDVFGYRSEGTVVHVTHGRNRAGRTFPYGRDRVVILGNPTRVQLGAGSRLEVAGSVWRKDIEVWRFNGPVGVWWRVFYDTSGGEKYSTYPDSEIRIIEDGGQTPRAAGVLRYWRSVLSGLPPNDPLQWPFHTLDFVHKDSILSQYLAGESILESDDNISPMIFPFSHNLSQREAVTKALHHSISVIDGPPGTGKTQTILNLIANIVAVQGKTVGVVSFNNAAVDNVRDKLTREGIGFVVAGLGNKESQTAFFANQSARNAAVDALVDHGDNSEPGTQLIDDIGQEILQLQERDRTLAQWRHELDAYQLELAHFARHFDRRELPELENLPLLRRSSEHILDYLIETEPSDEKVSPVSAAIHRVTGYFRFGSTRGIDPNDTDVVLRLQQAFYDKRILELRQHIDHAEKKQSQANFGPRLAEHQRLSAEFLSARLRSRYSRRERATYLRENYKRRFSQFSEDYPVILSTCHSLQNSIVKGQLLDYLIIDEASQVNLLTACLALASCRNLIVVGDLQQLQHIANDEAAAAAMPPPAHAYDYQRHNILSSLIELYGDALPRTMLREHYRCDPAIIGFCNKKFYDGQLIAFTTASPGTEPLKIWRTTEGNHMRQHRGGGRSNQREVDVINREVLPALCADIDPRNIGITAPYRRQVNKVADAVIDSIEADTVHRFQGREKDVIIMTTVLDETWRGKQGGSFVDDPHLVNVAVSRAVKKFILVTNHSMMPTSRNLRDLVGYIRYHNPDQEVVDASVVSVFDLLYREYSSRLHPLSGRLKHATKYRSENIIWTVLQEILAEELYSDFYAVAQVQLRNLLPREARLNPEQLSYVKHRSSVDFVVYNRITNELAFAVEVDGFTFHENKPEQLARDTLKDEICAAHLIPLLRLPTTGSDEVNRIRQMLDSVINGPTG